MLRRALAIAMMAGLWSPLSVQANAPAARREFDTLLRHAGALSLGERSAFVNNSFNQRLDYRADLAACGHNDCWQTPTETLALGQGDCEDFAIAKFFALLGCGQPCGCARLAYTVRTPPDTPGLQSAHIVLLAAGEPGDPLVFDNINPLLLPLSLRSDLHTVLSFDTSHLWRGATGERAGDSKALLRPWRELLQRWQLQH